MKITLKVWRQKNSSTPGEIVTYDVNDITSHMSFLEMLDVLNERLIDRNEEPIAFDHDCREGICGACSLVINGIPHGPQRGTTACQLHMRAFKDGETVYVEPWRAQPFPVIKDLIVDRTSFDRIVAAGGYISVGTGSPPDANALPIAKDISDLAMDAAACIGCAACVAACPNGSAMLFTAAKASHLNLLPQGQPEKDMRTLNMVHQMDAEGFGNCTNYAECQAACPKEISINFIAQLNRDFIGATMRHNSRKGSGEIE